MKLRSGDRQAGQTLVQVAILMVVFLLMLALAIDVGAVYQQRREMQNAADAGALAGARALCFGDPNQAHAQAQYYAEENGAEHPPVVTIENWVVDVNTNRTVNTLFGNFAGIAEIEVHAEAAAACGAASSGCGLWPIGFSLDRWEQLEEAPCGTPFYVWAGHQDSKSPDCDLFDCDVNDDGVNDIVDQLGRAWLDFSDVVDPEHPDDCVGPGCGEAEMACLIRKGEGSKIFIPSCIAGAPGVKAGLKQEVDARIGDTVAIPLFTSTDCPIVHPCPGTSIWAAEFGCVVVLGWEHSLELPRLDGDPPPWKGKAIKVSQSCEPCETYCGGTPGDPPVPGGLNAVSLIK